MVKLLNSSIHDRTQYYLAEMAMIGLIADCCRTAPTPRDNLKHARTAAGIMVDIYFL